MIRPRIVQAVADGQADAGAAIAALIVVRTLGSEWVSRAEAAAVVEAVRLIRRRDSLSDSLPGLMHRIAANGELPELLDHVRAETGAGGSGRTTGAGDVAA